MSILLRPYTTNGNVKSHAGTKGKATDITGPVSLIESPSLMPNRLAQESSPYLLQHKDNPVKWYPWGEEAFVAAQAQDKPIFLSIGYSTCHWCHVMEEESFEDDEAARAINDAFIPIKVDREERPDVDNVYMSVCQMMTGRGGWPLTVLLTPDRRPFYAATYLPKRGRMQQMGVMELTERVSELWETNRDRLLADAEKITDALTEESAGGTPAPEATRLGLNVFDQAARTLSDRFDDDWGGFGRQPKFPSPHNHLFLLREHHRTGSERALEMVTGTLDKMRLGGMFDHVGFGFHRYSTDRHWLLPHFEKMLYDQATLMMAYVEAYQVNGAASYADTAREVLRYLDRDMMSDTGAFYSAEDADSLTPDGEKEEGAFYVWTTDQLRSVLSKDDAEWVIEVFQADETGNFADESTGQKTGANILHLRRPLARAASSAGASTSGESASGESASGELASVEDAPENEAEQRWERVRRTLLAARNERPRPALDDKVLTDWNGLLVAALAKGGRVLPDGERFTDRAVDTANFLLETMQSSGRLLHRYRNGDVDIQGHLDDEAFLLWGLIELYETTFEPRWLRAAVERAESLIEHFEDENHGGFYFTAHDAEALIVRQKEFYDGAMPSGNSAALLGLVRVARLTGRTELEQAADRLITAASEQVSDQPAGFTGFLLGLHAALADSREIVVAGDLEDPATQEMIAALRDLYLPNTVVLHRPDEPNPEIADIAPFTQAQTIIDGRPAAYVCQNFACQRPVESVEALREEVSGG